MTDKEKIREEVVGIINSINLFAPDEDGKNSSYEEGRLVVASQILQIIDSFQEESVSKDLEKENKIEILANIIFNAAKHGYMPYDTQDEYCAMEIARKNIDKFIVPKKQEEPVSEDLGEYINELSKQFPEVSFAKLSRIAIRVAKWQKKQFEKDCTDLCNGIATAKGLAVTMAYDKGMVDAREQMMANATEVTVHIDAGGYPYTPEIELYDYDKDVPLAKEGDKYKVILIKEN